MGYSLDLRPFFDFGVGFIYSLIASKTVTGILLDLRKFDNILSVFQEIGILGFTNEKIWVFTSSLLVVGNSLIISISNALKPPFALMKLNNSSFFPFEQQVLM
jgi:hypothetical protein